MAMPMEYSARPGVAMGECWMAGGDGGDGGDEPASPVTRGRGVRHSVEVSYLEIYNEGVRDLFNPDAVLAEHRASYGTMGGGGGGIVGGVSSAAGGGLRLREDPR